MCDCIPCSVHTHRGIIFGKLGQTRHCWNLTNHKSLKKINTLSRSTYSLSSSSGSSNGFFKDFRLADLGVANASKSGPVQVESDGFGFAVAEKEASLEAGVNGVEFLNLKGGLQSRDGEGRKREDDLIPVEGSGSDGTVDKSGLMQPSGSERGLRSGRQVMKRSSMIAKQVISMESAFGLGFVSQLWVDAGPWTVLAVEVKPSLLSGETERFLLEDVSKIGDVVLVHDDSVVDYDFEMAGLESLVGYNVVTRDRQKVGKVRGYNFRVDTGAVQALELDSFGIPIIPSSLVSTYSLVVEDVLEVVCDTIVVHEAALSRLQRLTKGFWDTQSTGFSSGDFEEFLEHDLQATRSDRPSRKSPRNAQRQKRRPKKKDIEDDWELPIDFF